MVNLKANESSKLVWIFYIAGTVLTILSLSVLIGWHTENSLLIQLHPTFVPMQYNTALCFFLLGIGTISYASSHKKLSDLFGFIVFIIAATTLLEYITDKNFGIDQFFFKYNLTYETPNPGRMAFNTAICFITSSIILLLSDLKRTKTTIAIKQIISAFIVAVASISLYGYFSGSESASVWTDISRMAFHTAVGFLLFGSAFFIYKLIISFQMKLFGIAAPISMGLMLSLISIGVFQGFSAQEDGQVKYLTSEMSKYLVNKIEDSFRSDLNALNRMAERWPVYRPLPLSYWQKDVDNYYNDIPSIESIKVVDEAFITPINETFKTTQSPSADMIISNTHEGFLDIIIPIREKAQKQKFLYTVFNLRTFFLQNLKDSQHINQYQVSLYNGKNKLLTLGDGTSETYEKGEKATVSLNGLEFQIYVFYTSLDALDSLFHIKYAIIFFCVIMTILSMLVIYFTQLLYKEKIHLKNTIQALDIEKNKSDEANRAKSSFLANMSHEIRTPLNGIIGTSSLLSQTSMNEKQVKYSTRIESCGNILLNLINDILDISKIESGELKLESIPVNLQATVKEITDYMKYQIEEKGLELIVNYSEELYMNVYSDSLRLKQILQNLLSNAIKFTQNGQIILSVTLLNRIDDQILVKFEVKDSGIGISPDKFSRLFQKFSQVDESTTRKFGGTGLGLSICKQLIKLLGGDIHVKSEEGKGSIFWFELPFQVCDKEALVKHKDKAWMTPINFEGQKALIVDDNIVNCEIVEEYVKQWHLQAVSTQSPVEALRILQHDNIFSLIILDYNMPQMNGLELAKQIRENVHTHHIPIILLSSDETTCNEESMWIDYELIKPIYPVDLQKIILKATRPKTENSTYSK